jgi:cytochrome c-type biogenesis protein CcsB
LEVPENLEGYKLEQYVSEAIRKAPAERNKFDKEVLKVDERFNIVYMVFTGSVFNIFPKPSDENNKWFATIEALQTFAPQDGARVREVAVAYFIGVEESLKTGDWSKADKAIEKLTEYQMTYGKEVYPSDSKIKAELFYNKYNIFEKLMPFYLIMGLVLLILSFVKIIQPKFKLEIFSKSAMVFLILLFALHTVGLILRWYISGHAPWSNGYESMIYIAWATVLAGFIFSRNSAITLAATGVLSGLILFVAHLNWLDPQVTNLVPVLQSYWLSIHVSMITASYGFLALGALLGFISLILFALRSEKSSRRINLSILELNTINEMSLIVGLVLLTVGNFLGGVWANESWGRYWGWDPKETWALVSILLYAVVIHLRFIKAVYTPFIYAAVSLLVFSSIVMTYFGVNYYLAGMHSYAKGDPVPVPDFVPWTYAIIFLLILFAARNRKIDLA